MFRNYRDYGEWLYDVVWLNYWEDHDDHPLRSVPLVAECEWGFYKRIKEDFQKLLLARATVRLMIYNGDHEGSRQTAERLAKHIRKFNGSHVEDAWLLAAWERACSRQKFKFSYFRIDSNYDVVPLP